MPLPADALAVTSNVPVTGPALGDVISTCGGGLAIFTVTGSDVVEFPAESFAVAVIFTSPVFSFVGSSISVLS
jgi:hypothetical protein